MQALLYRDTLLFMKYPHRHFSQLRTILNVYGSFQGAKFWGTYRGNT